MKDLSIFVQEYPDGYVAYAQSLKGIVVGEGDTYEDALADCKSAIQFHVEVFGADVLATQCPCNLWLPTNPQSCLL